MKLFEALKKYHSAHFKKKSFRGKDLTEAKFSKAKLAGADFRGANLTKADFSQADIRGANFSNSECSGTIFSGSRAGLQPHWTFILLASAISVAMLSSIIALLLGVVTTFFVFDDTSDLFFELIGGGILVSLLLIFFAIVTVRMGVVEGFALAAPAAAIFGIVAYLGLLPGDGPEAGAGGVALIGACSGITVVTAVSTATIRSCANKLSPIIMMVAIFSSSIGAYQGANFAEDIGLSFLKFNDFKTIEIAYSVVPVVAGLIGLLGFYVGSCGLNEDKKYAWVRRIAMTWSTIKGTNFYNAHLNNSCLAEAVLQNTNFKGAQLRWVNLHHTKKLHLARCDDTYLQNKKIRQLAVTKKGKNEKFDYFFMRGIDLKEANLVGASFIRADLSDSCLQNANLSGAKLVETQLREEADLSGAILTGACIENWGITHYTKLDNIRCKYVFMQNPTLKDPNPRRKPDNFKEEFRDGEFSDFIRPIVDTLDLYHNQPIDPRAIAISYDEIDRNNRDAELEIVSFERRGTNKILIRVKTASHADKSRLSEEYFINYDQLKAFEESDVRTLIANKDENIKHIMKSLKFLEERPMTEINQTFNAPAINVAGINKGTMIAHMGQSTDDIVKLLTTLQETVKSFPEEQKEKAEVYLGDLVSDLNHQEKPSLSKLKTRIIGLLSVAIAIAGSVATATDFANNVFELSNKLNVPVEAIRPQLEEFKKLQSNFEWQS